MHMIYSILYGFFKECGYYELDPWGTGSLTLHILESDSILALSWMPTIPKNPEHSEQKCNKVNKK